MLTVRQLQAGYGPSPVLRGVDFTLEPGEVVVLLGRNGSGRSTLAKALMGRLAARGSVRWHGQELVGRPPHEIARLGLGHVPEGREVFPSLTVQQNLLLGLPRGAPEAGTEEAYGWFPALHPRRHAPAAVLSGGEQQMLSLARALLGGPQLLIVDEPTEGLSPQAVEAVSRVLAARAAAGTGLLLIEQRLTRVQALADRVLVMGRGELVFGGSAAELQAQSALRRQWLEL